MTTREEVVRNRKRLYPAPKPAISREAFRNAYMTLKLAEQRLFHDEALTRSVHGPLDTADGEHMQTPDNASAGNNSTGPEEDAEPMESDDVSILARCAPPTCGLGQTCYQHPSTSDDHCNVYQANGMPDMEEQRAEQQRAEQELKEQEEAAEQERMTQKMRDKEQRRVRY